MIARDETPRPCDRARYAYGRFAERIARLATSREHTPSDPDDATLTLDRLIAEARELTGINGPKPRRRR